MRTLRLLLLLVVFLTACQPGKDITETKHGGLVDASTYYLNRPDASGMDTDGGSPDLIQFGCGDGVCLAPENCNTCAQDCGECSWCGDDDCTGAENCTTCPMDCGGCEPCGNGTCDPAENAANCPADCTAACGDNDCTDNETTANCPQDCGSWCGDSVCNGTETAVLCPQDCDKQGGGDDPPADCSGCLNGVASCQVACQNLGSNGGFCGAPGSKNPNVCCVCTGNNPTCGDGSCNGTESFNSCPQDCEAPAPSCGDGNCNGNESSNNCPVDCGAPPVEPPNPNNDLKGFVGGVKVIDGQQTVTGWACHLGWTGHIDVHLYVGGPAGQGTIVKGATANLANAQGVNDACQAGGSHRFHIPLTDAELSKYAGKAIYVHGISPVNNENLLLSKSGDHHLPGGGGVGVGIGVGGASPPDPNQQLKGYVDGVTNGKVFGWACHIGWTGSIDVHLYVGGPAGQGTIVKGVTADNGNEAAVNTECQAGGSHRFTIPLTSAQLSAHSGKAVYVHGISPVQNGNHLLTQSGKHKLP